MDYKGDTRMLSIQELEKILISTYGNDDRSRGCYVNGKWLSIDDILSIASANI